MDSVEKFAQPAPCTPDLHGRDYSDVVYEHHESCVFDLSEIIYIGSDIANLRVICDAIVAIGTQ